MDEMKNEKNDDLMWNLEIEIDDALRSAPLAGTPPDLYARVMDRITAPALVPQFRLTLMDAAVSLTGSFLVAMFLAFYVFMPVQLRPQVLWLAQWIDYLGMVSLVWVLPCLTAAGVLISGFVLTRSLQNSR